MSIKHLSLLFVLINLIACSQNKKQNGDSSDEYSLVPTKEYASFEVPSDVKLYMKTLHLYTDPATKKEYLTFQNVAEHEILVYDWDTKKKINKILFEKEGPNGVGRFHGYIMKSFDEIYLAEVMRPVISVMDSTGKLIKRIHYPKTTDGTRLNPSDCSTLRYIPFEIIGDKIYITQGLNRSYGKNTVEKSKVTAVIDTLTKKNKLLPMKYPVILSTEEMRTQTVGSEFKYSRDFNGEKFIYSFSYEEKIHVANLAHDSIQLISAKSRFIKSPEILGNAPGIIDLTQKLCELPMYGNLIYDKFRKVYYRFVFHKEIYNSKDEDFMELWSMGRNKFSIIILDEDFKCVGETEFPTGIYSIWAFFIREDGLYLSTSHYKNPTFSDDVLQFERIELKN